jgi:hypothetical protein
VVRELGQFTFRVIRAATTRPYEFRELIRQMDEIGSKSAFLVILAGAAMGVVLSLETRSTLVRFGAKSSLPAVIIISIITESGPIITASWSAEGLVRELARRWIDEGDGSDRCHGSFRHQPAWISGGHAHSGLHVDASATYVGCRFSAAW